MRPITPDEILDLTAYERVRKSFLARMIEYKKARRVQVGEVLTFVFENRETVIFQIQEMTRVERSVDPDAIAAEVRVYNELIPAEHELSATLMIEIEDLSRVRAELDRLIGIDEHVSLSVGGEVVRATFDPKQFEADRLSAVQYIRFPLGQRLAEAFCDPGVAVELHVRHPNLSARATLEGAARDSLAEDLRTQ